jgi:hypothetical protein
MLMTTKLFMIAAIVAGSHLLLDTSEAQAQRWQNLNRASFGQNARVYSQSVYRTPGFSNQSYRVQTFSPYTLHSSPFGHHGGYRYPSNFGYGSNFGNFGGYGYPTGRAYRSNFGNYGYRPNNLGVGYGNRGFGGINGMWY